MHVTQPPVLLILGGLMALNCSYSGGKFSFRAPPTTSTTTTTTATTRSCCCMRLQCISCHNITNVFFMLPPHNTTTLTTAKTIAQQTRKCLCSACQHYYNHHQLHHSPVHINIQKFCFYHSNHRNNHHRRHTHCGTLASSIIISLKMVLG
uniref:Bursicon n=1 Tax=Glossina palpalis gambiensis TaxID=67801 RepID=A0A1B0BC33_9MUSC